MHEVRSKIGAADKARSALVFLMTGLAFTILSGLAGGCTTAVSAGHQLVGYMVDDMDVKKKAGELIGQPPSTADEKIGERLETMREVNGSRRWIIYPVENDPLDKNRYIVEVENDKITAVTKAEKYPQPLDYPKAALLFDEAKGKSPEAVAEGLGKKKPIIEARSEKTKQLVQCYDVGQMDIKDIKTSHLAIVRYDASDKCESLDLFDSEATTKGMVEKRATSKDGT